MSVTLEDRVELIKKAVEEQKKIKRDRHWIENDSDGFTGWRWDKYKVPLRIVCAANRYGDFIVVGARHYSPQMNLVLDLIGDDAIWVYAGNDRDQGFIDQYDNFHTRREAMDLCIDQDRPLLPAGQSKTILFSEHLY